MGTAAPSSPVTAGGSGDATGSGDTGGFSSSGSYRNDTSRRWIIPPTDSRGREVASGASWISSGMSRYSKMRSNSAMDEWICTVTISIWPIGKKSRLCNVVKAAMVPAWIVVCPMPWWLMTRPATRYTIAGVMEKNVPISAKKYRPTICCLISSSASRWFSVRKRLISKRCRPNTLASRMPETESVSCVIALISAIDSWVTAATARRCFPTRAVKKTNTGVIASDRTVSCHDRINIAISVLMMITTFDRMLDAVSVTTLWTPPTSFWSRDWISPVRVLVKNRSGMCWRCSYRELR